MGRCVLLIGVAAGCATRGQATSADDPHPYQGHRWRITEVKSLRSPIFDMRLPGTDHAWIAFDHADRLTAYDLVQHYDLSYRATTDGFVPIGYRGSAGWTVSPRSERVSDAVSDVLGDRFHPVKVGRLADGSLTLTAFFHDSASDPGWHPVVELICRRDSSAE